MSSVKPGMYQSWRELAPIAAWCAAGLACWGALVLIIRAVLEVSNTK